MIYITHDIDWISPLHPISVAKSFTHGNKWLKFNKLFQPNIFLHHIDKLIRFNETNLIKSIWLTGAPQNHTFQKFGLRYTADCRLYNKAISQLLEANCEIGLHSVSNESFQNQYNVLSDTINKKINYHRSHYLKFNEKVLFANLQQHGVKTDFSYGNARKVEIPLNIPHFTLGVNCVPTVLFDNAFFYQPPHEILTQFNSILRETAGTEIAILFHPENFAVNPDLWEYYEEILKQIKAHNKDSVKSS